MLKYIVIGNGVAGTTAVEILVKEASPNSLVSQFTTENFPYYWRPKLPSFLQDDNIHPNDLIQYNLEWYKEKNIILHLNEKVERIFPKEKYIETKEGEYFFDRLLIATGAESFCPPIPGLDLENSLTLRSLTDAIQIRKNLKHTNKVVIIGGGILGIENALSIVSRNIEVSVVEFFNYLLPRQLDPEGGGILQGLLEQKGIKFYMGGVVEKILGDIKVEGVKLKGGTEISADLVLLCTGIAPRVDLANDAGLAKNKGIIVNDFMETSVKDIYAAGDVAEHNGRIYGLIPPSVSQAKVAAQNMINPNSAIYSGSKVSATLKVADLYLTSLGYTGQKTDLNLIERKYLDEKNHEYVKLFLYDNRIHGAIILGTKRGIPILRNLVMQNESIIGHEIEVNQIFPNLF